METKILIVVKGGIVQSVHTNKPNTSLVVVDFDNIDPENLPSEGEEPLTHVYEPDSVQENLSEVFANTEDEVEALISKELKEKGF